MLIIIGQSNADNCNKEQLTFASKYFLLIPLIIYSCVQPKC